MIPRAFSLLRVLTSSEDKISDLWRLVRISAVPVDWAREFVEGYGKFEVWVGSFETRRRHAKGGSRAIFPQASSVDAS